MMAGIIMNLPGKFDNEYIWQKVKDYESRYLFLNNDDDGDKVLKQLPKELIQLSSENNSDLFFSPNFLIVFCIYIHSCNQLKMIRSQHQFLKMN